MNLYLLNDKERSIVGETYVKHSKELAKSKAVNYVSKRLPFLVEEILKYEHKYKNIVLYCQRGGYRSKSFASLLNAMDIKVHRLESGYKGYRKYVRENLNRICQNASLIVLAGNTGCGKTKILQLLKDRRYPVIDLEDLAKHRGSNLGHVGLEPQPSQKMFESLLLEEFLKYGDKNIFIEGESSKIGDIYLPKSLLENIKNSYCIRVDSPLEHRVSNLVEEYGKLDYQEELLQSLSHLEGYISKENIEKFQKSIMDGDLKVVARELCENYYDKKYKKRDADFSLLNVDEEESVKKLIAIYEEKNKGA